MAGSRYPGHGDVDEEEALPAAAHRSLTWSRRGGSVSASARVGCSAFNDWASGLTREPAAPVALGQAQASLRVRLAARRCGQLLGAEDARASSAISPAPTSSTVMPVSSRKDLPGQADGGVTDADDVVADARFGADMFGHRKVLCSRRFKMGPVAGCRSPDDRPL